MLKNHQENKKINQFWFGFTLGVTIGGIGLFLLGTKNGRSFLRKIIESAEELDFYLEKNLKELDEKKNERKTTTTKNENRTPLLANILERIYLTMRKN